MSIEQKSNAPATKERLGTIPRQAGAPAVERRRTDAPARAAKAIIGLCATATLGALAAAALAGVGGGSPTIGAYGSMANSAAIANKAGFPMTSGSLQLDGLLVRPDSFSADFTGVVRLTWTGAEAAAGKQNFSVAVRKDGRQVASLTGAISNVAPGASVTVPVASTDRYVSGPWQFSLGTGVTELSEQGTINQLNGLAMVEDMRTETVAARARVLDSRADGLGDWRWAS
jgi:hypothetical protein